MSAECPDCIGAGQQPRRVCLTCHGSGSGGNYDGTCLDCEGGIETCQTCDGWGQL